MSTQQIRTTLPVDATRFAADDLMAALRTQGAQTAAVIRGNELTTVGVPGPRWEGSQPPPLERVLFHLLQEYARHLGHLDVVAELAGGPVGE
ncbi:DUF664 domain-containing protein [Micromonospora sp. SL4-19]|uniref:mycothiol transferase n=1 Tax=Micromonospora sp. SL4-19 TaxID=3399129 RepID=UPI003A4D45A1